MNNARTVSAAFSSRFWPRLVLAGILALAVGTAADLFAAPFLALTSICCRGRPFEQHGHLARADVTVCGLGIDPGG